MNFSFVTKRLGFDSAVVDRLPERTQLRLALEVILTLFSCVLYGLSAAYLAYIECYAQRFAALLAIGVGVGVFLFALNIQRLFITAGGFGVSRDRKHLEKWRPDQLRLFCSFLLAVLFSQPLLLCLLHGRLSDRVDQQVIEQVTAFRQAEVDHIESKRAPLIVRELRNIDILKHSGSEIAALTPTLLSLPAPVVEVTPRPDKPAPSEAVVDNKRKALVMGVQKYLHATSLSNPVKDAIDMAGALKRMGYQVTLIKDPHSTSKDLTLAVHNYLKSLHPGDISLFYFSGHGFSEEGSNYLAASDSPNGMPLSLTEIIEEIGKTSPRANILVVDACSSRWNENKKGGLAGINTDLKNTYVAFAASPGQSAIDQGPNTNSLFTEALRRHIEKPEGIDDIFARVRSDVMKKAESYQATQTPLVMNTLAEVSFRLSDKAGKPGSMASASSQMAANKPEANKTEADKPSATLPEDPCRAGKGYDVDCLFADTELTRLRLVSLEKERGQHLDQVVAEQKAFLEVSGHLEDRFRLQWMFPIQSFLLTVVLTLLLWMGDLVRDGKPVVLREYELERYDQARKILRDNHQLANRITQRALDKYPADKRARIPVWNAEKDFFFEGDVRRPDHRERYAELPPESVYDLIADLRKTSQSRGTP